MFFKLVVLACVATCAYSQQYGKWVSTSPHRNDPIPPGISPPAQFPAGVDPHSCPNYPHCGNPTVALGGAPQQGGWNNGGNQWNAGNQWNGGNNGGWNGGHNNAGGWNGGQNTLDSGSYTGDGDYHGEGLQEAGAFGDISHDQRLWNNDQNGNQWNGGQQGAWNAQPQANWNAQPNPNWNAQPHAQPAQLPAGVSSGACPNYPYCH